MQGVAKAQTSILPLKHMPSTEKQDGTSVPIVARPPCLPAYLCTPEPPKEISLILTSFSLIIHEAVISLSPIATATLIPTSKLPEEGTQKPGTQCLYHKEPSSPSNNCIPVFLWCSRPSITEVRIKTKGGRESSKAFKTTLIPRNKVLHTQFDSSIFFKNFNVTFNIRL